MKGGQASPMFPTSGGGGKKRGCGFENPEPSSPKVTCIGQVRVKTKKQGKKMRSRSKRRGEASFRRGESHPDLTRQNSQSGFCYQNQQCLKHRNQQRWVHLPLTICEALREFSCFFPCRSSCMSSEKDKEEKGSLEERGSSVRHGREGSCGAAFARWLVSLQDGDGKGREIEVMMDDDDDGREKGGERSFSQRRHIFEDLDIDVVDEKITTEFGVEENEDEDEDEKGRVSICIPPKNALLLMRCRSDPVKMAALANRFWESPLHKEHQLDQEHHQHQDVEQDHEDSGIQENEQQQEHEQEEEVEEEEESFKDQNIYMEQVEELQQFVVVEDSICERETQALLESYEIESKTNQEEIHEDTKEEEEKVNEDEDAIDDDKVETFSCVLLDSHHADLEKQEIEETHQGEDEENKESFELSSYSETLVVSSEVEKDEALKEEESETAEKVSTEEEEEKVTEEKELDPTHHGSDPEISLHGSTERENGSKKEERERERETLPECLLLMMCEPKLSMEVSKETWVCSTDFVRWLPERPAAGKVAGGEKRVTVNSSLKPKVKVKPVQPLMQPARSSCSFPVTGGGAGMSMATMIEQKLVGCSKSRNGYEPFVLTRCKSEPMRSAAKLAPEACFWNNRKLEPHPPPTSLGIGAPAGVGF